MLQTIFHQIKNQRKQNAWIFLELLFVSFFLFTVIDPLYVLYSNRLIPRGLNPERCYQVGIERYEKDHPKFDPELDNDSVGDVSFRRIGDVIRQLPEVESFVMTTTWSIPNGGSWSGGQLFTDTATINRYEETEEKPASDFAHAQTWGMVAAMPGSDLFRTYDLRDAKSGEVVTFDAHAKDVVYLSGYCARLLFGTTDVVGKTVYDGQRSAYRVGGVFRDVKNYDYQQPYPMFVNVYSDVQLSKNAHWRFGYVIKLKQGVEESAFRHKLLEEMAPQLSAGNFYVDKLTSFAQFSEWTTQRKGLGNTLRLKTALAIFALLCIFLGMVGTFWIRCEARRQEIGLMRSMGASESTVVRQFLIEAWMLVTLAALITLPLLLFQYQEGGFYTVEGTGTPIPDLQYPQNRFAPHFFSVWGISYLFILLVSLAATYIPTRKAVKTLPAEALRDE